MKLENFSYTYTAVLDAPKDGGGGHPGKVQAVRVRGGYFFGPAKKRR